MTPEDKFLSDGWVKFPHDADLKLWIDHVRDVAWSTFRDPKHKQWHRHQGTWFVGVNVLQNDTRGQLSESGPLCCQALDLATRLYGVHDLDPAQVSVITPGYPKQDPGESDANHRFRLKRDAAHVDGLNAVGPLRRRSLNEPHAFILGLPLGTSDQSPLTVWRGSHTIIRSAFAKAFGGLNDMDAAKLDITDIYRSARKQVFEECERVEVPAHAGEATLVHRLTVHGVAPWSEGTAGDPRGILYFRPALKGGAADWINLP